MARRSMLIWVAVAVAGAMAGFTAGAVAIDTAQNLKGDGISGRYFSNVVGGVADYWPEDALSTTTVQAGLGIFTCSFLEDGYLEDRPVLSFSDENAGERSSIAAYSENQPVLDFEDQEAIHLEAVSERIRLACSAN